MRSYAAGRQPQLSIEELCHLKWLLGGVLALLSVWTLFHLEASIWPFALVATIAIAGTMLVPVLPARVPRAVWRLAVPAIAIAFVLDALTNELVLSLVRLNTMLVMYRAVSYRRRRDDLQLLVLSLFLIVLTGVLTVSLAFVAQILLFTGAAMVLLFIINVVEDATGGTPPPPEAWARLSRRRFVARLRQVCNLRMFVLAGGLFAAVVLASTVIFLAIPRFEINSPVSLFSFKKTRSLTGFSENIALGEVTDIKTDNAVALRVDLQGGAVAPAEPYWRMVALDEYDAGAFRVSQSVRDAVGNLISRDDTINPAHGADLPDNGRVVVFIEPGVSRYLPQPGGFSTLRFKETQDVVTNDLLQVYATARQSAVLVSYQIQGADFRGVMPDARFGLALYERRSPPAASSGRRASPRANALTGGLGTAPAHGAAGSGRAAYPHSTLEVPVSAEARAWLEGAVREITGGEALGAVEFARRACAYLDRGHSYSMQVRLPPLEGGRVEDPVIRWLQSGSPGHCEFFAAAFTLLGRTAGHPVRVVTGFKGGTWNAFENYFMIRHADAHAWCEIYDGEAAAWRRVDPTPGAQGVATADAAPALTLLRTDRSTAAYLDSLRMIWYRRIVHFDQRSQRGVAETLQAVGRVIGVWASATVRVVREQYAAWQAAPWSFASKGDILYLSVVLFFVAVLMKRLGLGTSDVFEWFRRGHATTRQRAGLLLRRLETRVANPPRRSWDEERALWLAGQLTVIRFGRVESWPEPLRVFRAVRRIL